VALALTAGFFCVPTSCIYRLW